MFGYQVAAANAAGACAFAALPPGGCPGGTLAIHVGVNVVNFDCNRL